MNEGRRSAARSSDCGSWSRGMSSSAVFRARQHEPAAGRLTFLFRISVDSCGARSTRRPAAGLTRVIRTGRRRGGDAVATRGRGRDRPGLAHFSPGDHPSATGAPSIWRLTGTPPSRGRPRVRHRQACQQRASFFDIGRVFIGRRLGLHDRVQKDEAGARSELVSNRVHAGQFADHQQDGIVRKP